MSENSNTGLFTVLGIAGIGLLLLGGSKVANKKKYKKPRMSARVRKKYIVDKSKKETFLFETEHFDKNGKMHSVKLQGLVPEKGETHFWTMHDKTKWGVVYAKSNDSWNANGYKIKKGQRLKLYTQNGSKPVYFPTQKDFKTHKKIYGLHN